MKNATPGRAPQGAGDSHNEKHDGEKADGGLCRFALLLRLDEFVEDAAHAGHSFRAVCLATAETRHLNYDHAVSAVRARWPDGERMRDEG